MKVVVLEISSNVVIMNEMHIDNLTEMTLNLCSK